MLQDVNDVLIRLDRQDKKRTKCGVVFAAESQCAAVERLVHATAKNPNQRYRLFDQRFPKFPSYLRRAAIEAACGQVSSFVTRYAMWQSGRRKRRAALPPLRTNENDLNKPRPHSPSSAHQLRSNYPRVSATSGGGQGPDAGALSTSDTTSSFAVPASTTSAFWR